MKKSELKKLIKEELKSVLKEATDNISQSEVEGAIATFLSDIISKQFVKYVKSGTQMQVLPISGLSGSGAYRSKQNKIVFTIEPKNLDMPPIQVELLINIDMRKYRSFKNKQGRQK